MSVFIGGKKKNRPLISSSTFQPPPEKTMGQTPPTVRGNFHLSPAPDSPKSINIVQQGILIDVYYSTYFFNCLHPEVRGSFLGTN